MQNTVGFIVFSLLKVQSAIVLMLNLTYTFSEKRKLRRADFRPLRTGPLGARAQKPGIHRRLIA